jgi:Tfp pilus assembly protein PilO
MKLTEKQQLIAILAGAGVLVLGELAFAWVSFDDRGDIRTELTALESRQQTADGKLAQIPQLRRRARELSEIVDQYTEILPREDEVSPDEFLDDITALCKEVGLMITQASPVDVKQEVKANARGRALPGGQKAAPEPPKTFVRHKYIFEMEGEFPALHRFVNGVENHTRFLQIDHLGLEPVAGQKSGKQDELELAKNPRKKFTVEISTYTYSRPPQVEEAKK